MLLYYSHCYNHLYLSILYTITTPKKVLLQLKSFVVISSNQNNIGPHSDKHLCCHCLLNHAGK